MKIHEAKNQTLELIEGLLRRIRYIIIVPIVFLMVCLLYVVLLMGERLRQATQEVLDADPFDVLVYLIDIVDFTVICMIIMLIIRGAYELYIRPMTFNMHQQVKADRILVHDLDELKQKLGKVIIVSLVIHLFKQILIFEIQTSLDMILMGGLVLLLALSLYIMEKMGNLANRKHSHTHDVHLHEETEKSQITSL